MLKNYETPLFEIDRYTMIGACGCMKRIESRDPQEYAEKLLYEMGEEAEELGETVQSTAEEIAEALLTAYVQFADKMLNAVAKISDKDIRSSSIEYYTAKRDKAVKWLEQYESANN